MSAEKFLESLFTANPNGFVVAKGIVELGSRKGNKFIIIQFDDNKRIITFYEDRKHIRIEDDISIGDDVLLIKERDQLSGEIFGLWKKN
jgi:hypothetical protein